MSDPFSIIKRVINTEKSQRLLNVEKVLTLEVDSRADKGSIRKAVEDWLEVGVEKVRTHNSPKGFKVAYVKLSPETNVEAVASKLGLL